MTARALTDEEVVARIQLGETELYQALAERHSGRLYATVRRIIQNPNDVEDVLQQAHLRALQRFGQFEGRSNILTWLTRVAVNEAYTFLRRRRDCQPLDRTSDRDDASPREFAALGAGPEERAIQDQLRTMLDLNIASLPPLYRVMVSLRMIGEMPTTDTAACLGISAQSVKTRLLRARRLLQRKMCDGSKAPQPGGYSRRRSH
jgi:RNA polymerase sigma-70 factor (ECF subfamily)